MGMKKTKKPERSNKRWTKCHCVVPEGTAFHMCTESTNSRKAAETKRKAAEAAGRAKKAVANVAAATNKENS